jgi:hypothetical protein
MGYYKRLVMRLIANDIPTKGQAAERSAAA